MQAIAARDARVERALEDAAGRVAPPASIHAQLLEEVTFAAVDFRSFIHKLASNVQRTFSNVQRTFKGSMASVSVTVNVESLTLPEHLATP